MTVDCEQAVSLISSQIDGQISADDEAILEAHLSACASCRAASEATALQDAAMMRALAGGRDAAAALAQRVAREAAGMAPATGAAMKQGRRRGVMRWDGWLGVAAGAAAVLVVAMVYVRPSEKSPGTQAQRPVQREEAVAQLALVSGEVFACPSGQDAWQPVARGAGLAAGTKVRTADAAKCELALPDGSKVRLNSDTELHLPAAQEVQLSGGQIFSAVPQHARPLRIAAGNAHVTTGGPAAQLDVARVADAATVTVVAGSAQVQGQGQPTTVRGGEFLHLDPPGKGKVASYACGPVTDPVKATRWLDDLLLLLPAENPELLARVDALLARMVAERDGPRAANGPGPVERDVRGRGEAWAAPLARYAINHLSAPEHDLRDKRRIAARLLADVAPTSCVADLIPLLGDEDGEVRFHAAAALNRLTGQTLGFSPDRCAAMPRDPAALVAWQEWWSRNRSRYPRRPSS